MNGALDTLRVICRLADLADPGSRSFTMGSGDWPLKGLVVRKDGQVFAYLNRCPHAGHPLNWHAHEFLSHDRKLLLCTSHGALFDIASGACVAGPCAGASLRRIDVIIENDYVLLGDDPELLAAKFA